MRMQCMCRTQMYAGIAVVRPGAEFGAVMMITLSPAMCADLFVQLGPFWLAQARASDVVA